MLTLSLVLWVLRLMVVVKWGVRLSCQHLQSFPGMSAIFTLIFLLSFSRICFGLFYVFQHAPIPSSLFTGLHKTYYKQCSLCMLDTNFVLSVTIIPVLPAPDLHFFNWPSVNCVELWGSPVPACALSSSIPYLCPLCSFLHPTAQGPCYFTKLVFLHKYK